jgi:hypothetical protein
MNILDLEPAAFAAALDELGLVGEQRDALIAQYSDPSRGYQRDERPFFTRLGDNIIGFDDGVKTQGERIGQSVGTFFDAVREDPLGVAGDMVTGLYGDIERGVRGELSPFETFELAGILALPAAGARFGPTVRGATTVGRRTGDPTPDAAYDPWSNLDFDDGSEPPEDWLDDIVFGRDPDADLAAAQARRIEQENLVNAQAAARADQLLARRDALIAALGGEASYQNALRGGFDMDPADFDEAGNNLGNFPVLERTIFDPEDGPQPDQYTIGRLAAMDPDAVRALAAQIENDPTGSVYSPELVDMLADMTPQELEEITGLPIAGAGTGFQQTPFDPNDIFQQTPFDPNDIDYGPDIDQIAAGADDPFAGGTNPWTNVQGAEDLAANFLPAPPPQIDIAPPAAIGTDPFRGLPGTRVLNETAPAVALPEANPYMPTDRDFQIPQTWMDQGIAGAYSRSGRAADRLGQPQYTDIESLRRELEKHGAAPGELRYQLDQFEEAMLDGPLSREDIQRFFYRDTGLSIDRNLTYAGGHMPSGGRNGTSTVYYHPAGQNYPPGAKRHYDDAQGLDNASAPGRATTVNVVPLFHSRAAQYDLGFPGGGTTHHVAEIQSDFSQYRQGVPRTEDERAAIGARMQELLDLQRPKTSEEISELTRLGHQFNGPLRDDFDEQFDAPYVRRENDWVDAAVRQNLLDAVNSGSDWITFGNGKQANKHSFMPLEAAKSFYDNRVPKRIEDVLRRFANEAGIDAPTLESVPFVDGSDVRGFRITPEFREALLRTGLPSYRFGGIVSLMRK